MHVCHGVLVEVIFHLTEVGSHCCCCADRPLPPRGFGVTDTPLNPAVQVGSRVRLAQLEHSVFELAPLTEAVEIGLCLFFTRSKYEKWARESQS